MSLTYRTPMEDIVAAFEPAVQSAIANTAALGYKALEERNFEIFNFYLSAIAKQHLSRAGIYLSPFSAVVHSHPVCKTLENHMLYVVLPQYIDSSFYFVGIKNRKLSLLKKRHSRLDTVQSINRLVTSVDKLRYSNEFVVYNSKPHESLKRHSGQLSGATLRDLVPPLKRLKAKKLFLHDELHYWDHKDLTTFLEVMQPEVMLGTIVYPPELIEKQTKSLNPWCYTFEVIGKSLMFYPDGVVSEGYQQPIKCGFLLECHRLILANGDEYNVDVLASKYAHHLVSITKDKSPNATIRSFGPFEATSLTGMEALCSSVTTCFPVPYDVVNRIYRYLRTLKKPDVQSAMAKLGQIVADPTGEEINFVQEFAELVIETPTTSNTIAPKRLKQFVGKALGRLPKIVAQRFKMVKLISLDQFIKAMEPYNMTIETIELRWNDAWGIDLTDALDCECTFDLVNELDKQFENGRGVAVPDRVSNSYIGILPLGDVELPSLLCLPPQLLRNFVIRKFIASRLSFGTRKMSREDFNSFTNLVCQNIFGLKQSRRHTTGKRKPIDWALELFGELCNAELCAFITTKVSRWLRFRYHEIGARWFTHSYRGYVYHIEEHAHVGRLAAKEQVWWGHVVEEVLRMKPKIKTLGVEATEPCQVVLHHKVEGDTSPVGPRPTAQERTVFLCYCGLEIATKDLKCSEHAFTFPDQLKGRLAGWYNKGEPLEYRYNGGTHQSLGWPDWLADWCLVNGVGEQFDSCLVQQYEQNAKIGFHKDDEKIFKSDTAILTCNITGQAEFGFKCEGKEVWYDLVGSTHFTMPKGFQKTHMHAVRKVSDGRISATFRELSVRVEQGNAGDLKEPAEARDDEIEDGVEVTFRGGVNRNRVLKGKVNGVCVPMPGDGSCFWHSLSEYLGVEASVLKAKSMKHHFGNGELDAELAVSAEPNAFATDASLMAAAAALKLHIIVFCDDCSMREFIGEGANHEIFLRLSSQHFEPISPKNGCVVKAIASALGRNVEEVIRVVHQSPNNEIFDDIWAGEGLDLITVEHFFHIFGIAATVTMGEEVHHWNPEGHKQAYFVIEDDHMTHCKRKVDAGHKVLKTAQKHKFFDDKTMNLIRGMSSEVVFQPDVVRARVLANSLHSANTGVLSSALFNECPNLSESFISDGSDARVLRTILGTYGSGKSTVFKKMLANGLGKIFDYVSPRRALADDFRKVAGLTSAKGKRVAAGKENWKVSTFETFLGRCKYLIPNQVVVIDEVQLYPPGYLDLIFHLMPQGVHCFIVGDPCQSDYDSEGDRLLLQSLESNCSKLLKEAEYNYNVKSKRFVNANFIGRLSCHIDEEDCQMSEEHHLRMNIESLCDLSKEYQAVVLVSSFDEKKMVDSFLSDCKVMTYGESTGLTFDYGTIIVSQVSDRTCEKRWITALSRFRKNVCILNCCGVSFESLLLKYKNRALGRFLCKTASTCDITPLLPGISNFTHTFGSMIGADEGVRELKMVGDPWLKTMIDLMQSPDVQEVEELKEIVNEEWFKTHLPIDALESVRSQWVHKILAKEFREHRIGSIVSDQFTDQHSKQVGAKQITNAAERYETIYPRHRANDTVTFLMAVKKRLRFSRPMTEKAKLFHATNYGQFLLKIFLDKIPLKRAHDANMMAKAKWGFEEKKTSKSAATIENHSGRSCRDWLIDVGMIFSKSQLCTKFDNRFRNAKAAQSIVCFQHSVLCRFAPFMRYIEMKLQEVLPKKFYIHSGKGLEELSDWVKIGRFEGLCTESDYEAFDASQDEYIVAFELALMKYLGLPNDLIEDYKYIKTHLGSKLGNFAIMRFSGEASTFLFNTMANMLFTFMRYNIKGDEFICFAGDDMCASKRLTISKEHESFLGKLKLKAKVQFTKKPTFCGWHLCPDGIYKKPQLVLERMCIAQELNNLSNCIDNYAIEVAFAYNMGERAVNRMDEEELSAFYNCVRLIVRNKHLLKSDVKAVFEKNSI